MLSQDVVAILFIILAVAVIGWIAFMIPELRLFLKEHASLSGVTQAIFNAAPVQQDANKASEPVKVVVKDLIPIIFWLLVILPMFIFPIVLIIFPIFHIPWSYLLPPQG